MIDGYFSIENKLSDGDVIEVRIVYPLKVLTHEKRTVNLDEITSPVTGILCYGPYIMAIDNNIDYAFLAEPNNNFVYSNTVMNALGTEMKAKIPDSSFKFDSYLTAHYKHGGFSSYYPTVFRPVSEMTFQRHPYMMLSMDFIPE